VECVGRRGDVLIASVGACFTASLNAHQRSFAVTMTGRFGIIWRETILTRLHVAINFFRMLRNIFIGTVGRIGQFAGLRIDKESNVRQY
jgi:hypothetical protein